jgi:hypothetical protein
MWGLGQHTLLGIVVGYVTPRATHFTGYCCWFMRGLGQHTLLAIVVGQAKFWAGHHYRSDAGAPSSTWVQNNPFYKKM